MMDLFEDKSGVLSYRNKFVFSKRDRIRIVELCCGRVVVFVFFLLVVLFVYFNVFI